jgi:hypothetical protein
MGIDLKEITNTESPSAPQFNYRDDGMSLEGQPTASPSAPPLNNADNSKVAHLRIESIQNGEVESGVLVEELEPGSI